MGPAGVGKTAIVEGLAQRLVGGDVPLALRSARLLAVDHVALLAGTTYRGQYEERIRVLVEETRALPDVILFIDELHNLIGQGTALGVAMDAANMLKPALVRGDFRVIGATTDEEYDRWIRSDPALERRFQRVLVRELSSDETLEILRARRERLERHHNVVISDDALRAAVSLTDQHQTDRRRPDRAIDALDEACAHTQALAALLGRRGAPDPAATRSSCARRPRLAMREAARSPRTIPIDQFARNGICGAPALRRRAGGHVRRTANDGNGAEPGAPSAARGRARSTRAPAGSGGGPAHHVSRPRRTRSPTCCARRGVVVRGVDVARVVAVVDGARGDMGRRVIAGLWRRRGDRVRARKGAAGEGPYADKVADDIPKLEKETGLKFKTPPETRDPHPRRGEALPGAALQRGAPGRGAARDRSARTSASVSSPTRWTCGRSCSRCWPSR